MDKFELEIKRNGVVTIPDEFFHLLLVYAKSTIPRRGSSTKNLRIKKKIAGEAFNHLLLTYIKENIDEENN